MFSFPIVRAGSDLEKLACVSSAVSAIRIASFLSHANIFCQSHSHSIHLAGENSLCLPRIFNQRGDPWY